MKSVLAIACWYFVLAASASENVANVFPGTRWETRSPEAVGLSSSKLDALRDLVGGRGCVVRHGYMVYSWGDQSKSSDVASAFKPLLSTLLFLAIQEGRIKSVDDLVADFEPRLKTLNRGKDATMKWRNLASQTSGYGLSEAPDAAYSYNDFALALYYDTLMEKVFATNGTTVLKTRLAEPLQFEDDASFDAFHRADRQGRLALSVRDFARFGLLFLRGGKWHDRQLIEPAFVRMAISSPIAPGTPLTSGVEAEMLPGQRSVGGTRNITPVGPGYYSFNWWLNRTNRDGQRLFVSAPPDTYVASGHGGMRALWIIPSLDLVVCWNDSPIADHDQSPGNEKSKCNQAVQLMVEATAEGPTVKPLPRTTLGAKDSHFTINSKQVFLHGISYYSALSAPEDFIRRDLDDMQRFGFNWIRVWANWRAFEANAAAVDGEGGVIPATMERLQKLIAECDRRGMVVDVTLSRGNGVTGPKRLQSLEAHHRAVETLITALKPWRNWYLDLSNERNIRDSRYASIADLKQLRTFARQLDQDLLVTASHAGDLSSDELRRYVQEVGVDFIAPHRPRNAGSPAQTTAKTGEYLTLLKKFGHLVPVHYQEPFRRDYGKWNPEAGDFSNDLRGAIAGGAAGWCFHNGDARNGSDGQPRRSFDLRGKRLFEQFDDDERKALVSLKTALDGTPGSP